jgi:hemolysin D
MLLQLKAFKDLLARYGLAFSHAWGRRKGTDARALGADEAQFLPAALALQETPAPIAPRVAMWLLIAFAAIALLWSVFGKIDVVATAQGKIALSGNTKTVQPLEAGVVKAIYVKDNQLVQAGDVLIELDSVATQADTDRLNNELSNAHLQAARAAGMLSALTIGVLTPLKMIGNDGSGILPDGSLKQANSQLQGQFEEYAAKLARSDATLSKKQAEWRSAQTQINKLEQTIPIAKLKAEDFKRLVDQQFMSNHGYLERQQTYIEQVSDLATTQARLKELDAGIKEAQAQRQELVTETRRMQLDSLSEARSKIAAYGEELLKANKRGSLTKLTAPVSGTVQQLVVNTVGGVVTAAQVLMVIVPKQATLEVEALLENKDVGFVNAKQSARVKVETFQFTKYGTIDATITSMSSDAINDEKRGLLYLTRAQLAQTSLNIDGKKVSLSPGMAVTLEIKTGQRRVIEYFLSPLVQRGDESLKER